MPCDGEGGDLTWDDFYDDRAHTFDRANVVVPEWLFNQGEKPVNYEKNTSPLDYLIYCSVGGKTSIEYQLDDYKESPYMREFEIVDGERFAQFDSVEELKMEFSSITSVNTLSDGTNNITTNRIDGNVLTIDFNVGLSYDRYCSLKDISKELGELWSSVKFGERESSTTINEKERLSRNDNLMALIFEFIDTKFLIKTCSNVCSKWHKIILYDSITVNQIFMSRTLNYFKKEGGSLVKLNQWYGLDWLETYFVSGMFQFEIYGENIRNEFDRLLSNNDISFFYIILNVDPLQNLKFLPENHTIIQKLSKFKPKKIFIAVDCLPEVSKPFILQVDHCLKFGRDSSSLQLLEKSLFCVKKHPEIKNDFSLDFNESITLYLEFLKSISEKLSPIIIKSQKEEEIEWVHRCMLEMIEKADFFLNQILSKHPCTELLVEDDILIGLHLILLNNYYINQDNLFNLYDLDFTRLLINRKERRADMVRTNNLLPPHLKVDVLDLIGLPSTKYNEHKWDSLGSRLNPFQNPFNAIEFIREHIMELSEIILYSINETEKKAWILEQEKKYLNFINYCLDPSEMPDKGTDLIFHCHMLHPIHFVQDCLRLTNRIKAHNLNFSCFR